MLVLPLEISILTVFAMRMTYSYAAQQLQDYSVLINIASDYIKDSGLRFNPSKTSCMTMGCNPFTTVPQWSLDNVVLKNSEITREGFLRKNIVAVSFFSKLCYTPVFLIHVHIFFIK